jgi:hypothetical protein
MGINQKGLTPILIVVIVGVLLITGIAGYYVYHVRNGHDGQSGTIDVKELGVKLTLPNRRDWNYTYRTEPSDGGGLRIATFDYQGYGSGVITRYNAVPNGYITYNKKQIGSFYLGLTRTVCPCNPIGEQAYDKLNAAFNLATAD